MERLRKTGVRLSTSCYVEQIGDGELIVSDIYSGARRPIDGVDAVVLATGRMPVNELEAALDGRVAQLYTIGDALAPRMWAAATFEGHKFARLVGETNAAASVSEAYFGPDDPWLVPIPSDTRRPVR